MVREIIWTHKAQNDRKNIFEYWNNHNNSNLYSIKLNQLFKESLKLVYKSPYIGKKTNKENVRVIIIRNYLIFYEIQQNYIIVLTIWDCNQNPSKNKYKT